MKHHYNDITSRVNEPPTWWDENGTPRYGDFTPYSTGRIGRDEAVLMQIECQNCGEMFDVSLTSGVLEESLAMQIKNNTIHYGDPPNSGCCPVGSTMNSIPRKIIQYWVRESVKMVRDNTLEVNIVCDWAD